MKVKFTQAYSTKAGNRLTGVKDPEAETESFKEDQVVDFAELRGSEDAGRKSALHFINRGVAVKADDDKPARKSPVHPAEAERTSREAADTERREREQREMRQRAEQLQADAAKAEQQKADAAKTAQHRGK